MTRAIFVADDAGFAQSTDDAILACAANGPVCCAAVVANGPTAAEFVRRARGIELGLHVNLTEGFALSDGRALPSKHDAWRVPFDPAFARAEIDAQLARLRALGVEPAFVNGHNHVHVLPEVRDALPPSLPVRAPVDRWAAPGDWPDLPPHLADLAREIAALRRAPDAFTGFAFSRTADPAPVLDALEHARREGLAFLEIMVHPGARPGSRFTESFLRDRETAVLQEAFSGVETAAFSDL